MSGPKLTLERPHGDDSIRVTVVEFPADVDPFEVAERAARHIGILPDRSPEAALRFQRCKEISRAWLNRDR